MLISLVRSVADVAAVVASLSRTLFVALEPTELAVDGDNSVAAAATLAVVVTTVCVPRLTVSFGAVGLVAGCEGDVSSSIDAMAEDEVVEEVDADDDDVGVGVVEDSFSVTNSSGLC